MKRVTDITGINTSINSLVLIFVFFLGVGLAMQSQKMAISAVSIAILPLFIFFVLFRLQMLGLLIALLIPLSVNAPVGGSVVSLPGEAFILVVASFYLLYSLNRGSFRIGKIWKHPVTILLLLDLAWSIFTGLIGDLPVISLKRVLIKGMFIAVFYFFFIGLFKQKVNLIRVWLFYGIGLIIPVIWTLYNHSNYDFSKVVSFVMPLPFYNDHTLYAACIAFILPVIILFGLKPGWFGFHRKWRFVFFGIVMLFLVGEYFSYSRAAWLSIIAAAVAGLLIVFMRFKVVHFLFVVLIGILVLSYYSRDIYQNIGKVDDVSRKENIEEHFRSVMNIQTDASNLERINRWQCAVRMFRDKPVTGFGPGTYQFVYAKYQVTSEMTRISTNHGEKGNAHSEYLMYLSETGLAGLMIFLLLNYFAIARAIKIFNTCSDKKLKWFTFSIMLGLLTFLAHGTFNSFIDTDKAAILFYAAVAAIVSIDSYHSVRNDADLKIPDPDPGKGARLPSEKTK